MSFWVDIGQTIDPDLLTEWLFSEDLEWEYYESFIL